MSPARPPRDRRRALRNLGEQPTLTGWVGAVAALGGLWLWILLGRPASFDAWLVPLLIALCGLGLLLVVFDAHLRRRELRAHLRPKRPIAELLAPALLRWSGWLTILAVAWAAYNLIGVYDDRWYDRFDLVFRYAVLLWVLGGIPYYLLALRRRYGLRWDRKDPAILTVLLLRRLFRMAVARSFCRSALRPFWRAGAVRSVWLGLLVKAFFLPLMLTFFFGNAGEVAESLEKLRAAGFSGGLYPTAEMLYFLSLRSLMFIDVCLAVLGYAITSRFIDNGIRSVEPTVGGWVVALLCYRPFNELLGWYFRWPREALPSLPDTPVKLVLMASTVGLIGIYVWATIAFGLRFSNLTHRGIVTRGPYAWVRHPAYISKNLAWWLEHLPSFAAPRAAFFMLGWNIIYGLRAFTEERHLAQDPRYRQYMALVPSRFFPSFGRRAGDGPSTPA